MVETIEWTSRGVVMIDQTRLPLHEEYVTCRNYQEVATAIRDMIIRGAPAIGVAAAMGVAIGVQYASDADLDGQVAETFSAALCSEGVVKGRESARSIVPGGLHCYARVLESGKNAPPMIDGLHESAAYFRRFLGTRETAMNRTVTSRIEPAFGYGDAGTPSRSRGA